MNARAAVGVPVVLLALLSLAAGCSSSSGGGAGPADAAPGVDTAVPVAVQHGRIVDFSSKKAVAGATVAAGGQTALTASDGTYSLNIDANAHFSMNVIAPGYIKLIEQTTLLDADRDRGDTLLVATADSNLLKLSLDEYDATRGVLSIQIIPVGGCEHVAGAKVHVDIDGARVAYFKKKFPVPGLDEAVDGELPTAVIYNVPPGRNVAVAIEHPTCKSAPSPYVYQGITYFSDVTTEAGDATSFARYFLE